MTTPEPPPVVPPNALQLLAASQPDIVRATQKDDLYVEQFIEATREVIRRWFGPFRALQYARESKLLALLLYHGLTTGLGTSTLGEEYCGILQVAASGQAPSLRRRLVLSLLLSLGPYATDRLGNQLDSAVAEAEGEGEGQGEGESLLDGARHGSDSEAVAETAEPAEEVGRTPAVIAADPLSPSGIPATPEPHGAGALSPEQQQQENQEEDVEEHQRRQQQRQESGGSADSGPVSVSGARRAVAQLGAAAGAAVAGPGLRPQGTRRRSWLQLLLAAVVGRWARCWRAIVLAWPRARPLLSYAGRLHLALFYLYGNYYSLAHRLAGIRYTLSMRPLQGRPSYRFLGLLLGLQLAVLAGIRARGTVRRLWTAGARAKRAQREAGGEALEDESALYAGEDESAVLLEDEPAGVWATAQSTAEQGAAGTGAGGEMVGTARPRATVTGSGGQHGSAAGSLAATAATPPSLGSASVVVGHDGSSGTAGTAAAEDWEEVERQEYGSGGEGGWEADVFGVRQRQPSKRQRPAKPPPSGQLSAQPAVQQQVPMPPPPGLRTGGGGPVVASAGTGGAAAVASLRGRRAASAVIPVLTSLRQCPLCLSPKSHPTSTPCGHTFCWGCITTWCVEKPECPLCRAPVRGPQLVALYHTNC